jgi:hypothetical protein
VIVSKKLHSGESHVPSTAKLDMEYAAEDGSALNPAMLLILTMVPLCWDRMNGRAAFMTLIRL